MFLFGNSENAFVNHGGKPDDSVFDDEVGWSVGWNRRGVL